MLRKLKFFMIVFIVFFLSSCATTSTTSESISEASTKKQDNNYEFRIIEDPSTGMLTVFYEKDGNLYYRQISQPFANGDNITLPNDGWTEMKPPTDIEFISYE